jgi:EAL domain-containing protein (putative c-di-GMP-specific phosphodiesterase class I)
MRHILNLEPEIIKLDMSLTHSIDKDEKRRALARGHQLRT